MDKLFERSLETPGVGSRDVGATHGSLEERVAREEDLSAVEGFDADASFRMSGCVMDPERQSAESVVRPFEGKYRMVKASAGIFPDHHFLHLIEAVVRFVEMDRTIPDRRGLGDGPDVVIMPVREEDGPDRQVALTDEREETFGFGSRIDDDRIGSFGDEEAIGFDLAKGDDLDPIHDASYPPACAEAIL
jgi:hypothetical protein